jgi:hypothetical protein
VKTTDDVFEQIEAAWNELVELVRGIPGAALNATDADGWALKDHLVHIAAWEHSLLALLEGRDRDAAMGVGYVDSEDTDEINKAIWNLHRHESVDDVLRYFRDSHEELRRALAKLSSTELLLPYSHYQPSEPEERRPVIDWVAGNTYRHYSEHIAWIKERLASAK